MKLIPNTVSRSIARQILVGKKNSPHIFFAAGVAGVLGSTFLACRATLKLEETVDDIREDIEKTKLEQKTHLEHSSLDVAESNTQYATSLGRVYIRSAAKVGKLYGPSIVLGVASVGALTGSHVQLTRRNAALTATLAAVSKAYEEYRERVRSELGEEREFELYRGIHDEEIVDEKGKKKTVKVLDPNGMSPYAKCFTVGNANWQKDPELNRIFLQCQQNYFNQRLQAYGHVFLNEVYDQLGFERTSAGAVVGWVINSDGDNYIDFGLFEACSVDFMNADERSVWLDFNVDGVIYDKI